jgi:hypothetical protein
MKPAARLSHITFEWYVFDDSLPIHDQPWLFTFGAINVLIRSLALNRSGIKNMGPAQLTGNFETSISNKR